MKIALASMAAGILMGLIGCSGGDSPAIPQVGDVGQAGGPTAQADPAPRAVYPPRVGPGALSVDPYAALIASTQISDEERETARQIRDRIPHGAADPRYVDPIIGRAGPDLAVARVEGFSIRGWPTGTIFYPRGQIVAQPLWFFDPVTTTDSKGLGDDVLSTLYSPLRFAVNVVGLPASILIYPAWQPTITDRTPVFPAYMHVPDSPAHAAGVTSQPD